MLGKSNGFGHAQDPVSSTAARDPLPHAPRVRMTVVTQNSLKSKAKFYLAKLLFSMKLGREGSEQPGMVIAITFGLGIH